MRKIFIVLCITLTTLLSACAKQPDSVTSGNTTDNYSSVLADYPCYDDFSEILNHADYILQGKILDVRVEDINISSDENSTKYIYPHTIYTIEVTGEYKGEFDNKIEISQFGSNEGNVWCEDFLDLEINKEYIFFLADGGDKYPNIFSPYEGVYIYDSSIAENPEGLIMNANPSSDFNIKQSDLDSLTA